MQDGRALFFQYGCASCHGFEGGGGILGEDLDDASPSEIRSEVRDGPKGMPAFDEAHLTDEDLEKIVAFLTSPAAASQSGIGGQMGPWQRLFVLLSLGQAVEAQETEIQQQ